MGFRDWFKKDKKRKPCMKCGFGMSVLMSGAWKCSKCGFEKPAENEE